MDGGETVSGEWSITTPVSGSSHLRDQMCTRELFRQG